MALSTGKATNFTKQRVDLVVGIFIGIAVGLALFFYIQSKNSGDEGKYSIAAGDKVDTIRNGNYTLEIKQQNEVQVKEYNEIIDEKIKSFNDRISDLYFSLSIIIVLLIAIVGGVYLKTESEVTKHMNKNYNEYKDKILTVYAEVQEMLTEIKTNKDLSDQILANQQQSKQSKQIVQ
jgi:hypothetical protein